MPPVDRISFERRYRPTGTPVEEVRLWFGDSITWARDDFGDEHQVERQHDVVVTRQAIDALVVEWLRGPAGHPGPKGEPQ